MENNCIKPILGIYIILMSKFKPKNTKKIIIDKKKNITLDIKHKEMIGKFKEYKEITIPALIEEKRELLNSINKNDCANIEEEMEKKDRLKFITKEIKRIKELEMNYLLDNSKYIFDYFENKKSISEGNNKTILLNHFFKLDKGRNITEDEKNTNVNKYFTNVDESYLNIHNYTVQSDICKLCNKGELIPVEHDGVVVCNQCYYHFKFLVDSDKPVYKEPPKEVCFYAYKRINHFREILAQFQAKETTQIPEDVIETIKQQIKKERIHISQITNKRAKDILKKLGYNKYYEHIPFIKDKLGIKPPIMSPDLEERLCNLFIDIQGPYAKYCPDNRVNFLNYYYTVYKLCELLDQKQFLPFFPMLKDREKRIEQDEIWKKICDELNWEFISTI
jgi:hypothetical protein